MFLEDGIWGKERSEAIFLKEVLSLMRFVERFVAKIGVRISKDGLAGCRFEESWNVSTVYLPGAEVTVIVVRGGISISVGQVVIHYMKVGNIIRIGLRTSGLGYSLRGAVRSLI